MGLEGVSRMKEEDGGCCSQLCGGGSVHCMGTENFHLGQLTVRWSERSETTQMSSLEQAVLVGLGTGAGNRVVGMKNVCLKGSKKSPHFTRPNSIDLKTL